MKHFNSPSMDKQMLHYIGNTIFVIAPIIGYIPQLYSRNVVFSPLLSLMLITASLLKFYYWKVAQFESLILYQALALCVIQFTLIYNFRQRLGYVEEKIYARKNYGIFSINITILTSLLFLLSASTFLADPTMIYRFCGIFCLLTESSVGLVQIFIKRMDNRYCLDGKNVKRRLPKELFLCWIVGDVAKLYWMGRLNSPLMLTIPIVFQIIVDFILMFE